VNKALQKQIDLSIRAEPKFKQAFSSPPTSLPKVFYKLRGIYWRVKEIFLSIPGRRRK
jgi:hypothetical protein